MASNPPSNGNNGQKTVSATAASAEKYKVGPGRPPREYWFKKGQSGNPKGAKRKPPSLLPDLKRLFEQALSEKVTLRQGEKERTLTMAEAGIKQLVAQFAKGDRHARRDGFAYAEMLGIVWSRAIALQSRKHSLQTIRRSLTPTWHDGRR